MISSKEIGRRLVILRANRSRDAIANEVGISLSALSMYENGERIPRDSIKVKLAKVYNRTVQEIFFDEECHV